MVSEKGKGKMSHLEGHGMASILFLCKIPISLKVLLNPDLT